MGRALSAVDIFTQRRTLWHAPHDIDQLPTPILVLKSFLGVEEVA